MRCAGLLILSMLSFSLRAAFAKPAAPGLLAIPAVQSPPLAESLPHPPAALGSALPHLQPAPTPQPSPLPTRQPTVRQALHLLPIFLLGVVISLLFAGLGLYAGLWMGRHDKR